MKRFLSVLMVMMILCSLFTISTFAANDRICPSCGGQLSFSDVDFGIAGSSSFKCLSCGKSYFSLSAFGHKYFQVGRAGSSVSGGASVETPKQYYTAPSSGGSGTSYNGGATSYYSVMNTQNNTLNFTTYNQTTNNYTQNNYTYNNYTYNNEYNYYTYNIENHNYYVTNNYTYVTVVYPDGTKDDDGNDNYESVDIYYELPDGRNSSTLKAEDVWGQYFLYDFTNYELVIEDERTHWLCHFDGNINDSSAYKRTAGYLQGATYVYQDASPFGQAMYWDAFSGKRLLSFALNEFSRTEDFTIEARFFFTPNTLSNGDWGYGSLIALTDYTLVSVLRPRNSSRLQLIVRGENGDSYKECPIPQGSWFTVAVVRRSGVWYVFLNGVYVKSFTEDIDMDTQSVELIRHPSNYYASDVLVDEFRVSSGALYVDNYIPATMPFDTNKVLVLPEKGESNEVCINSNIPVSEYRIGGVRPTYPVDGSIYVYLENDVVKSVQQYQNNGWFNVDASIYADGAWKDFKGFDLSEYTFGPDEPSPSPDPGACSHEYMVDSEKASTCTEKGSITYKCKLCGDSYSEDVPALGHDWQIVDTGGSTVVSPSPSPDSSSSVASSGSGSTFEPTSSEPPASTQPPATESEYTLYRCSRCGMEYKDYEGSGPPSGSGEEEEGGILGMLKKLLGSIVNGIVSILETVLGGVIKLLVSLIDELVSGLTTVIDGLISSMGQIANFGGTFKDFLGQVFPFIPSEIVMLLGFSLSLSIILMIIKFFRG